MSLISASSIENKKVNRDAKLNKKKIHDDVFIQIV